MARLDLRKSAGFPIYLENGELFCEEFSHKSKKDYTLDNIRHQLLNSEVNSPNGVYSMYLGFDHSDVYKEKGINIDITLLMPNLAGIEYLKTHSAVSTHNQLIEVISGGGTLLLQNFDSSDDGELLWCNVKKGTKLVIPAKYDYSFSNTKSTPLVFITMSCSENINTDSLDDVNGMSYYVIRKNAKNEIVRNPEYRLVPQPKKINFENIVNNLGITSKTPIVKQVLRKYDKIPWFFSSDSINI